MPRALPRALAAAVAALCCAASPTAAGACGAGALAPDTLRVDGSAYPPAGHPSFDPALAYAVAADRTLTFTWAPRHAMAATGVEHTAYVMEIIPVDATATGAWSSGVVMTSSPTAVVRPETPALRPGTLYRWTVAWSCDNATSMSSAGEGWFRTALADVAWEGVPWTGADDVNLYRAEYALAAPGDVVAAVLYTCGLGFSSVEVNGHPASEGVLTTAPWTQNWVQNMYSTDDVTPLVVGGGAAGVVILGLADGWRSLKVTDGGEVGYDPAADTTRKVFRMQLRVVWRNGTEAVVLTSDPARWSAAQSPVTAASLYDGETYDARVAAGLGAYTAVGAPLTGAWQPAASPPSPPKGAMKPWSAPRVLATHTYTPAAITHPVAGMSVVDFGVNVAGVVRLSNINLPAGATVTLRHAEALNHPGNDDMKNYTDGTIYVGNLRAAKATDTYIAAGSGPETFQPRFTYHGFRYVEITGYGRDVAADDIVLVHIHSAIQQTTEVDFGSPLLNTLQTMAVVSQRSNMMTLLTDCDQRDERLGWNGDASLSSNSVAINYDARAFYRHLVEIMAGEAAGDGSLADIAPHVVGGGRPGDFSWTISLGQITDVALKTYGDTELVARAIDTVKGHMANGEAIVDRAGGLDKIPTSYGDWVSPILADGQREHESKSYCSAFSFLQMTRIARDLCAAVGDTASAADFDGKLQQRKRAFHDTFFKTADGVIDTDAMVCYSLAVAANVTQDRDLATAGLVRTVRARDNHATCGIIGWKYLFDGLDAAGAHDLSLAVLEQTTYPSMGYMVTHPYEPATTNVWEQLDAPEIGPDMNSRNHHMWGTYSAYMVTQLAGVDAAAGVLKVPRNSVALPHARTRMSLPQGPLEFNWTRVGGMQCAKAYRSATRSAPHATTTLSCGRDGGVIREVLFVSASDDSAAPCDAVDLTAANPDVAARCYQALDTAVYNNRCVGQSQCTLAYHDAAPTAPRCATHVRAAVVCSAPRATHIDVLAPIGAAYRMHLPPGVGSLRSRATLTPVQPDAGGYVHVPAGRSAFIIE